MLEMAEAVGTTWTKKRWDSFRLVTENSLCKLPDFPCTKIGEDPRGFMPRKGAGATWNISVPAWDDACLHNFTVANRSNCTNSTLDLLHW